MPVMRASNAPSDAAAAPMLTTGPAQAHPLAVTVSTSGEVERARDSGPSTERTVTAIAA